MCPEFLREGTAIADFYDSPLTAVGTADERVGATVQRLLTFLHEPVKVVGTRDAEGLKYACNAYHATKVSFANELGRLFRLLGVDSREVMKLFCEDTKLNISTTYLSPGFAFGGSCLPKDLRSLLYLARMNSVDLPLLSGTLASNALSVGDVVNRVLATDARSVALLGLSFKMDSDDLRESPYVDLAETLIGKGFDVRIYDPLVDTSKLVGANLNYVMSKLPHVQRAMLPTAADALHGADLALVSSADPSVVDALLDRPAGHRHRPHRAPGRRDRDPLQLRGGGVVGRPPRVHIIVQNLPVPFDRRVWLECRSLTAAGYRVSVVCPSGPGDPGEEVIDGVTLYKYRPPKTGTGKRRLRAASTSTRSSPPRG